jgi:CBS domain-containing protein
MNSLIAVALGAAGTWLYQSGKLQPQIDTVREAMGFPRSKQSEPSAWSPNGGSQNGASSAGSSSSSANSARPIREVMTKSPEVIRPEATLAEAAKKMDELNVGSLPVCDGERLVGYLTDRDITVRATAAGDDPKGRTVSDTMTREVLYCRDDQPVRDAAELMRTRQIRRLPIINSDKKLVGIVALGDLATDLPEQTSGDILEAVSEPSQPDR